jgi:hypothetical protein
MKHIEVHNLLSSKTFIPLLCAENSLAQWKHFNLFMRKEVTVAQYEGNVPKTYWTKDEFTILVITCA